LPNWCGGKFSKAANSGFPPNDRFLVIKTSPDPNGECLIVNNVKAHFEQEAREFDAIILKLIPYYPQMLDALVSSIPFQNHTEIKVIDLGCGTGTIAKMVKERYPAAQVHCIDIAQNMLEIARHNLAAYSDMTFENADLANYSFAESCEVVVSSLALHHLSTDRAKIDFYTNVYHALKEDGVFYNADVVLGVNDQLQANNMAHWVDFMKRNVPVEEIEQTWLNKYQDEDRPAKLMDQLAWLNDIGFKDTDIIWKYYNFAVYGGCKAKKIINSDTCQRNDAMCRNPIAT
jgi:tRNA (cmo5U34)-methyltransferase